MIVVARGTGCGSNLLRSLCPQWQSLLTKVLIGFMSPIISYSPLSAQDALPSEQASANQDSLPDYLPRLTDAKAYRYRTAGEHAMYLFVFSPPPQEAPRPAVIFFFGGGWTGGSVKQFEPHCRYLMSRGVVGIVVDYRVTSRQDSKIVDSVSDAFAAVEYVQQHAAEWNIDTDKIVAAGGSAGGHLAACTGIVPRPQDSERPQPDEANKPRDNVAEHPFDLCGMVLFNPVIGLTPMGDIAPANRALQARLPRVAGIELKEISPYDQVQAEQPPALIVHGTSDSTVPFDSMAAFQEKYRKAGNRCELVAYADQKHGFFNFGRNENKYFVETVEAMDRFLAELGVVAGPPQVREWVRNLAVEK